jgi:hypothetical protein
MADFSYHPSFRHTLWQDKRDLVEADGPNGFNIRFSTIESDLQSVSTVVTQIGTAMDTLSARVPPKPPTAVFTVAPTFQPASGATGWVLQPSGAAVAANSVQASGVLPLNLPDHIHVTSIKVLGSGTNSGTTNTSFTFTRVSLADNTTSIFLFDNAPGHVPLNTVAPLPDPALGAIDLTAFRYAFSAAVGAAVPATPITVNSIQFNYTNP